MSRVIVLMYHALYANDAEREAIASIDRPYAISTETFRAHLDCIAAAQLPVVAPLQHCDAPLSIMLTFDDGHASNYHHAFPILRERQWPGVFFVTSDFIEQRDDFCSWEQLREMSEHGMVIGAHGQTHRFFDDLDDTAFDAELQQSYQAISEGIGQNITTLSFPGGRYLTRQIERLHRHGFLHCFSSAIGISSAKAIAAQKIIPRIAIRQNTSLETFKSIIRAEPRFYWRQRGLATIKNSVRFVLGNKLYHALYDRLTG